jgi:signal transduction histidine kinase
MKQVRSSFFVFDNGSGVAAADLERIFENFLQHQGCGNWIGLAICQSMPRTAAAFRGSKRPQGVAHFRFALPVPTVSGLDSNAADFIRRMHQPVR